MKHILKNLKVPITFEEDFKTFQCNRITVQGIIKRNIIYLREVGDNTLVKCSHLICAVTASIRCLEFKILGRYKKKMLISRIKSLQLSIDVLKMVDDFSVLHNLLRVIEMPIDG